MGLKRALLGIPYAYNCEQCYRAVICPRCGRHIVQPVKGQAYARHFAERHAGNLIGLDHPDYTQAPDGCPLPPALRAF